MFSFSELCILVLSWGEALRLRRIVHTAKYNSKFEGHTLIMFRSTK